MSIRNAQDRLTARFATLRDKRTGPVFFIEHGLSETETKQLRGTVANAVGHHPIQVGWWRAFPLPLIVVATEVGYEYRGTGSDFWPRLEAHLRITLSPEDRRRIRDLFATASKEFRGAAPPTTRWSEAFHLIAWPITHALVPKEFHRPLSRALATLNADIQELCDDRLQEAVRNSVRDASVRFDSFLEDHSQAIPVIRALLGRADVGISPETLTRIEIDLADDHVANLDIATARRRQQRMRSTSTPQQKREVIDVQKGHLQLRIHATGSLHLLASFVTACGSDLDLLRRTLRRQRCAFALWDATKPILSERILSGLPFALDLHSVPEPDAQLFPRLHELGIDDKLLGILESFDLDLRIPSLFVANSAGDSARELHGDEVSISQTYWLLVDRRAMDMDSLLPHIGESGPLTCYKIDPQEMTAAETLHKLKYRVRPDISVAIAGSPSLNPQDPIPRFLKGDELIVFSKRMGSVDTMVKIGTESLLLDNSLVRMEISAGEHVIEVSQRGHTRHYRFVGLGDTVTDMPRHCWIELTSEQTVQALVNNILALRIDARVPLGGLTLVVELEIGSHICGTCIRLGTLPQLLSAEEHESLRTLLNDATRNRIRCNPNATVLHAYIPHLVEVSWVFERQVRPCWWRIGPSGPFLESEEGLLKHGAVSVASPAAPPVMESSDAPTDDVLLVPIALDESIFGPAAAFVTFFIAPKNISLVSPRTSEVKLDRALRGSNGSLGIEDLVEAWLRWSLAECESVAAEIRRRQVTRQLDRWLTELVCGEPWARLEDAVSSTDPWKLLADEYLISSAIDENLALVDERQRQAIIKLAVTNVQRSEPDLWSRTSIPTIQTACSDTWIFGDMECPFPVDAFKAAFSAVAGQYRTAGHAKVATAIESSSFDNMNEEWRSALKRVVSKVELWELAGLLLPTDTAQSLISLNLKFMPLEETVEEFDRWATSSRNAMIGEKPSSRTLKAILALWISPETAIWLDWRTALNTLAVERSIARAGRFLALRARGNRLRDPSP